MTEFSFLYGTIPGRTENVKEMNHCSFETGFVEHEGIWIGLPAERPSKTRVVIR